MKNLLFENIISKFAKPYSEKSNATRCRCVLLNKDCDKVAMIKRIKPDEEEYYVFPSGGIEQEDKSFIDTMYREITEELGLKKDKVRLNEDYFIEDIDIFKNATKEEHFSYLIFIGIANTNEPLNISLNAPELSRNNGIYEPMWVSLNDIEKLNIKHNYMKKVIIDCLQ